MKEVIFPVKLTKMVWLHALIVVAVMVVIGAGLEASDIDVLPTSYLVVLGVLVYFITWGASMLITNVNQALMITDDRIFGKTKKGGAFDYPRADVTDVSFQEAGKSGIPHIVFTFKDGKVHTFRLSPYTTDTKKIKNSMSAILQTLKEHETGPEPNEKN